MLDIEVVPELALRHKSWEIVLSMPIQQTLDILRKNDQSIKVVDFWYNEKTPFASNLIVVLPNDGLRFYFDPFLQRLRLIEIFDLSKVTLRYWSQYFNGPSVLPTIEEILRIFGSTKPLLPADGDGEHRLCYRGITFMLRCINTGTGTLDPSSCRTFTDSSSTLSFGAQQSGLVVSRLLIYLGNNLGDARVSPELPSAAYLQNVFLDLLEVIRAGNSTKELRFHLVAQDLPTNLTREPQIRRFTRALRFGDTVQDVLSALGSPSRVFYKTEDKMKIHLPQSRRLEQPRRSAYFFNYFTLGVDVLFDARYHQVTKFVLHTNQPGEYTFNTYYRCMFEIPLALDQNRTVQSESSAEANSPMDSFDPSVQSNNLIVTPFSNWNSIQHRVDSLLDVEPVVIHREARTQQNPFDPTYAYGYEDMIFEVIPTNGYLASVTIYAPRS